MSVYPGMWIVVELRQRLVETWTEFQRSIVGEAIEQWRNTVTDPVVVSAQRDVTSIISIRSDLPHSCIVTVLIHFSNNQNQNQNVNV